MATMTTQEKLSEAYTRMLTAAAAIKDTRDATDSPFAARALTSLARRADRMLIELKDLVV